MAFGSKLLELDCVEAIKAAHQGSRLVPLKPIGSLAVAFKGMWITKQSWSKLKL